MEYISVEERRFILYNGSGGFDIISQEPNSRYFGTYFKLKGRIIKVLEPIILDKKALSSEYFYNSVKIKRETGIAETHYFPKGYNSKIIELDSPDTFEVFLDIKEIFDNREWGRVYKVTQKDDMTIVAFEKESDYREDKESGKVEYKVYLVIKAEKGKITLKEEWQSRYYKDDHRRNSNPIDRYIFKLMDITTQKIVFSFGEHLNETVEECNKLFKTCKKITQKEYDIIEKGLPKKSLFNKEIDNAYKNATYQLDNLMFAKKFSKRYEEKAFIAGLPWFFQVWSRDECVAAKALITQGRYKEAKELLFKYLGLITPEGRIPNRFFPKSSLSSADAMGILFVRISELIQELQKNKKLSRFIKKKEMDSLVEILQHTIFLQRKYFVKGDLIYNKPLETWMDTVCTNDNREGFRIEIQALLCHMYKFMHDLTDDKQHLQYEIDIKKELHKKFWDEKMIADGLDDFTIRPNIFLAAYYFYDLFHKEEWKICFKNALPAIWLDWGGVSSIDKNHLLFQPNHTGEDNRSYHRGDSWYWVNNIAAMMLHKTDKDLFAPYIKKIIEASTRDINEKGIVGAASELSSARNQDASGCLCQTWSASTYIELVDTIKDL